MGGHLGVGRVDLGVVAIRPDTALRSWSGTRISGTAPKYSSARIVDITKSASFCVRVAST